MPDTLPQVNPFEDWDSWLQGTHLNKGSQDHLEQDDPAVEQGIVEPWLGYKIADNDTTITVRVWKGRYTRNADLGNVGLVLDCGADDYKDVTVGANQYLSAVVYRADLTLDPRLYPTLVVLVASDTADSGAVTTALGAYYGGHVVLGKSTAGVWSQWWHGGDITDDEDIPDSNTNVIATPLYKSLERKPETTQHKSELQIRNFTAGTASGPLAAGESPADGDSVLVRVNSTPGQPLEIKYATPQDVVNAASGTPGTTVPPHDHSGDEGDGGTIDHASLQDVQDQDVGDDHRGGRTTATGINFGDPAKAGHPYIHANGNATRNAMPGVIGDAGGVQSVAPAARTLDGKTSAAKGWEVTDIVEITPANYATGTLVVGGGLSVAMTMQAQIGVRSGGYVYAAGAGDAPDGTPSISSEGGVFAVKSIRAGTLFRCGYSDGITTTKEWEDANGQKHSVTVTGGIITAWTVT